MTTTVTRTFEQVLVGGNWSEEDQLDGKTLKDGEDVDVLWPNGLVKRYVLRVVKGSYEGSDCGRPQTIPTSHAFIDLNHNGAVIPVRLALTKIEVSRP